MRLYRSLACWTVEGPRGAITGQRVPGRRAWATDHCPFSACYAPCCVRPRQQRGSLLICKSAGSTLHPPSQPRHHPHQKKKEDWNKCWIMQTDEENCTWIMDLPAVLGIRTSLRLKRDCFMADGREMTNKRFKSLTLRPRYHSRLCFLI